MASGSCYKRFGRTHTTNEVGERRESGLIRLMAMPPWIGAVDRILGVAERFGAKLAPPVLLFSALLLFLPTSLLAPTGIDANTQPFRFFIGLAFWFSLSVSTCVVAARIWRSKFAKRIVRLQSMRFAISTLPDNAKLVLALFAEEGWLTSIFLKSNQGVQELIDRGLLVIGNESGNTLAVNLGQKGADVIALARSELRAFVNRKERADEVRRIRREIEEAYKERRGRI